MLHFAVCDDEPYMLDRLSAQISECLAELDCRDFRLSRFSGGQALLEAGERFDLVFLDIQMDPPVRVRIFPRQFIAMCFIALVAGAMLGGIG